MATTNPGPAITSTPEPQGVIGNIQKNGVLTATITPAALSAAVGTSQQTFSNLGLGLITTDQVSAISPPSYTANYGVVSAVVSAADAITVTFVNYTAAAVTPPAGAWSVEINRVQPNFSQNAGYLNSF